jgi:predicted ATPase
LSTSFGEVATVRHTNWYVITGAPCSGKTAVIDELERRGYKVIHEVARAYIDEQLAKGLQLGQIKDDELRFENYILKEKIRIESILAENETIFFDRGMPDSIAYFNLAGLDPAEPLSRSKLVRYKKIFLLERLGFFKDKVRSEDEETAVKLNLLIEESYRMLGYDIVPVPVQSIEARTDFILERI